jgi:hypothetical protein
MAATFGVGMLAGLVIPQVRLPAGASPAGTVGVSDAARVQASQVRVWSELPAGGRDTYGGTSTVRVRDVGGTRLLVISTPLPDSADMTAEIEAIVGSMRFE